MRDTLRELAAEQPSLGPAFADKVLAVRRRRHNRRLLSAAAATTAMAAMAVAVPVLSSGKDDVRPAHVVQNGGVRAHPDQSPPRNLVGAADEVLAAYYTARVHRQNTGQGVSVRTYWLLDGKTGTYRKDTRWSYVAIAPGLKTAAVLEQDLPAHRIGLLNLATGKVERWIPVDHGVGAVEFSRDGGRLVATTYETNPDVRVAGQGAWTAPFGNSSRSGFYLLDVASGKGSWSKVSSDRDINARQDFSFSRTGAYVYSQLIGGQDGLQQFYDLNGEEAAAPPNERYLRADVAARLSPDGRLAALGTTAEAKDTSWSTIADPLTGKEVARVRGAELLAWVNNRQLIAWERDAGSKTYLGRLALVTIKSNKVVWLSGPRAQNSNDHQEWEPVFARR
jgi:hypothetical protein